MSHLQDTVARRAPKNTTSDVASRPACGLLRSNIRRLHDAAPALELFLGVAAKRIRTHEIGFRAKVGSFFAVGIRLHNLNSLISQLVDSRARAFCGAYMANQDEISRPV